MKALFTATGLAIGYPAKSGAPARVVARGLELELRAGELVCLIGPNGAGKSTLLRTLAGIQRPLQGEIHLAGDDLAALSARERARRLAVVLTDRVAAGLLEAREVVALGRHPHTGWSGRLGPEDHRVVAEALRSVGAESLAGRPLGALSDGEQQRVMIARALAQEPRLLVLDEVTAFLDLPRRIEILGLLRRLARERGCGILLSIHDLELALRQADQIWMLCRAAGELAGEVELRRGGPEDLAISGELARAFAGEGLVFDVAQGGFVLPRPAVGRARVEGEGLGALWAGRALERLGFELNGDEDPRVPLLRVRRQGEGWSFRLCRDGEELELPRLGELGRLLEPSGGGGRGGAAPTP